jgi:hypothetical protein
MTRRGWTLIAALFVVLPPLSACKSKAASGDTTCPSAWMVPPTVDPSIAVPAGGGVFLLHALGKGTQDYQCTQASDGGGTYAWSFVGPEAVLTDCNGAVIGNHVASDAGPTAPKWQSPDGTFVTGKKLAASSPDASAVPWLLLQATAHGGSGILGRAGYIQRVNTTGGLAPTTMCDRTNVGATQKVSYAADYYFFGL